MIRSESFELERLLGFFTKGCGHVSTVYPGNVVLQQFGDRVGVVGAADGAGGGVGGCRFRLREQLSKLLFHSMRRRSELYRAVYGTMHRLLLRL